MLVASLAVPVAIVKIFCNDRSRYDTGGADSGKFRTAVKIFSDSKVALAQAAKPDAWVVDKLRHIKTAYFFFKSYCRRGDLKLLEIGGKINPADIFTKGFGAPGKTAANQKSEYFQHHALICAGRRDELTGSAFNKHVDSKVSEPSN